MSKDSPTNMAELRRALQGKQKKLDVKELAELSENASSADIVEMLNKIVRALKK